MATQDVEWVTAYDCEEEMNVEDIINAFQEMLKSDDEAVDQQPPTKISY